jgi:hypothetical protein
MDTPARPLAGSAWAATASPAGRKAAVPAAHGVARQDSGHEARRRGQPGGSVREAARGLHQESVGNVGSAVVFVLDDVQGGQRELLRQAPGHAER